MLAIQPTYIFFGALIVVFVVVVILVTGASSFGPNTKTQSDPERAIAFAFSGNDLIDASSSALEIAPNAQTFHDVKQLFIGRFPDFRDPSSTQETLEFTSGIPGDEAVLILTTRGNSRALILKDPTKDAVARQTILNARATEILAHSISTQAPMAIWATSKYGETIFRNAGFERLERRGITADMLQDSASSDDHSRTRLSATGTAEEQPSWFDISQAHGPDQTTIHYALNADAIVHAEAAQRNFVQTLTKTFAQLSIGLAIFDRNRQLALFNPSLIDLTNLKVEFLSARPSLSSFFDQLRDRQIMPEPRNYTTWRNQLSDMLVKAEDGIYCETWTLPSGLTYRISGKPHPDGAVAFLFEDISAEISLSRRFRAELEMSQSILDTVEDSMAVFSRSGSLTFSNKPFQELWKCNPDESFIEMSIHDMIKDWRKSFEATPLWDQLPEFVASTEMRSTISKKLNHGTKGPFDVSAIRLIGASTLVRFKPVNQTAQTPADG